MKPFSEAMKLYFRLPEHPAKLRIVRLLSRSVVPKEGFKTLVLPGIQLLLHPRDWVEYCLLRGEKYEPLTIRLLQNNLREGDTAIFAGVNFGLHVIVGSLSVGPLGRVIGIEPQPAALLRASANIELNDLPDNLTLVSGALGAQDGYISMPRPPDWNSGAASLLDSERASIFKVHVFRLPDILRDLSVAQVRLMLLDVEGYELRVLDGMKAGALPCILIIEAHAQNLRRDGATIDDLRRKLEEMRYSLFDLYGCPLPEHPTAIPENNVVALLARTDVHWVTSGRALA